MDRRHRRSKKRYVISAMAYNLGRLMRKLFGMGTPRGLRHMAECVGGRVLRNLPHSRQRVLRLSRSPNSKFGTGPAVLPTSRGGPAADWRRDHRNSSFSTGC